MKLLLLVLALLLLAAAAVGVSRALRRRADTMSPHDIQEGMKDVSDRAVAMAKADHDVDLDYSVESIERVEAILGSLHEEHRRQPFAQRRMSDATARYGAYVGEVIRRKWGGQWELDHDAAGPGSFPLSTQGHRAFPMGWCFKRIANGPEDNVWHKVQAVYVKKDGARALLDGDGQNKEH